MFHISSHKSSSHHHDPFQNNHRPRPVPSLPFELGLIVHTCGCYHYKTCTSRAAGSTCQPEVEGWEGLPRQRPTFHLL